jgi:uncharacterized repeat protein (TIGR03803 family)
LGGALQVSGGTVFKLANGSHRIITLVSFTSTNGAIPESPLIGDSSGNLYGTTCQGGALNLGTIFELSGGAAPAEPHMPAEFVTSAGQQIGAAAGLALAKKPELAFEPVVVAGQDTGPKKAATVAVERVKPHTCGHEIALPFADIDQLFSREWGEWQVVSR